MAALAACPSFTPGRAAGPVGGLTELSGLAASRAHPGVLWAEEDSGHPAALTALSSSGASLGTYVVDGATNRDWEDLAVGPGGLYVGDIGDNRATRRSVTVYRVAEPAAAPDGRGGHLAVTATYTLRYPGGPSDAEALVVDPRRGDLYVLTKNWDGDGSHVLRAPAASLADGATLTLEDAGTVDLDTGAIAFPGDSLVTAADVAPDGSAVLVRTYGELLLYRRRAGDATLADALGRQPCHVPAVAEQQGEAVAFVADGRGYVTASEGGGAELHVFDAVPRARDTAVDRSAHRPRRGWIVASGVAVAVLLLWVLRRSMRARHRQG